MKYILIIYAVVIHLLFFSSAIGTQSFDIFFAEGNVHEWQGIDFYQVTNGAYAWLRGGNLSGDLPEGVPGYAWGNRNVYHPFFTVLFGTPL